jgi:hypothetical protein
MTASQETGLNTSSFRPAVRAGGAVFRYGGMIGDVSQREGRHGSACEIDSPDR